MKSIEYTPFSGRFDGFGGTSYDSVAGTLRTKTIHETGEKVWKKSVLKWNRQDSLASAEEAIAASLFKQKSLLLYRRALGEEFITNTNLVVGNKGDRSGVKYKLYQLQPFIDGWTGKNAPEEVRKHPFVQEQWKVLSQRLFHLYHTADEVNRSLLDGMVPFPVTITLGTSRQKSQVAYQSEIVPATRNLLIERESMRLQLFDFGEYVKWDDGMQGSYDEILNRCTLDTV